MTDATGILAVKGFEFSFQKPYEDFGVMRMICDNIDTAVKALREKGYIVNHALF
jgi:hypothetical protein